MFVPMSISKEKFIEETGGFLWGELAAPRRAEIELLEKRLRSAYSEQDHRRLCELKGITFDAYDPEDHQSA